jgi:transketolase
MASAGQSSIEQLAINTIRTLSMDGVQQAKSGHPGSPMGMAPNAYVLWNRILKYDPADPIWPNRDRFVLSAGHASMLIYSLLHLAGVKHVVDEQDVKDEPAVSLEEIKRFRQLHSRTPGHPEYRFTGGVETTTGPLGQGVANTVGMAIAGKWLAARYNQPGFELFNYNVYAFAGDGCMQEGISAEAASLAGHLKLSNLCWMYDSNQITIEGHTDLSMTEDVAARFKAYGWHVLHVADGNDLAALEGAYQTFLKQTDAPTLIVVQSHIAWGSPNKQDTHGAHGEPLGDDEIKLTKEVYGFPPDQKFYIPEGVPQHFQQGIGARGAKAHAEWQALFAKYKTAHPQLAAELELLQRRELPAGWDTGLPSYPADPKGKASRDSGGEVLNAIAKNVPWLIGGSADLAPSTKTLIKGSDGFQAKTPGGRNLHFGIREHAMAAAVNGMAVTRVRPYGATFLVFSDYCRNSIRLAAIMEIPSIFIFTHDSLGVGEDGPTHQPIEHIASLRAIPGLVVIRPGDANETVEAWKAVMRLKKEPAALILSRQAMPTLDRAKYASAEGVHKGAYVLADAPNGKPSVILIGTGTELSLAVEAYEQLTAAGIAARVVSLPSTELFEHYCQHHPEYREQVLPSSVTARVSIEMGSTFGWDRYIGSRGIAIGMTTFGASAPLKDVMAHFGISSAAVVTAAKTLLGQ